MTTRIDYSSPFESESALKMKNLHMWCILISHSPKHVYNYFDFLLDQGTVVQRPISRNPGLNFNPAFFISLFKSLLGKIFTILFRTSNDQIASKKIWTEFSLKVFRPEIKFHTNPGLP